MSAKSINNKIVEIFYRLKKFALLFHGMMVGFKVNGGDPRLFDRLYVYTAGR
jgi:hypothetical protein